MESFFSEYGLTIGGILAAIAASVGGYGGYQWIRKPTLASNRETIERAIIASADLDVKMTPVMREGIKAWIDEHQRLRLEWPEQSPGRQ